MELKTLEQHLGNNARHLRQDLAADLRAEATHVTDPSQCGYIVRRHFDGIVIALYAFILLFLGAAFLAFYFYTHR